MATDPAFASTPHVSAGVPAVVETNLSVPVNAVDVFTGAANGSMVISVVVEAITTSLAPTTAAGLVYLFLQDTVAGTHHLYDTIPVLVVVGSASVAPFRTKVSYTDLLVPNGWKLRASVSANAGLLKVIATGGDI
jgi:hypothetical protein